uniref:Uncharacterized protein n=1 Tax=Amphimedon queenslandica TaxID=400682 RepID=A0A1X7VXB8_AMPQE
MYCTVCQKWGNPPAGARGAWTTTGICDWNHGTELLRQLGQSKWHSDTASTAAMAQADVACSVVALQITNAARADAERPKNNREIILKLLRSIYFLDINWISHTTVYPSIIDLQVANGDKLLEKHIKEQPLNAKYTSKFSATMLFEAINTWLERKLIMSLKSSPFFSILANESQDIRTQEELSVCFRWLVNGCPAEHFLTILHIKSTDAKTITEALLLFQKKVLTIANWLVRDTMEQHCSLDIKLEYKEEFDLLRLMLFTFIAPVTNCS